VPADNPRIQELRRRVDKDPASIVFAQLAEEYRRAGDPEEAVRVCRSGLVQHPTYVSARVTLGRSLMELGQLDEAQGEFEQVLATAPDNLIAVRSMAELYQRRTEMPPPLPAAEALVVPPPLPVMAGATVSIESAPSAPPPARPPVDLDAAIVAFNQAFGPAEPAESTEPTEPAEAPRPGEPTAELEAWLANIVADRDERRSNS
jgi:tetratricopeptide (TPR) repeat protein